MMSDNWQHGAFLTSMRVYRDRAHSFAAYYVQSDRSTEDNINLVVAHYNSLISALSVFLHDFKTNPREYSRIIWRSFCRTLTSRYAQLQGIPVAPPPPPPAPSSSFSWLPMLTIAVAGLSAIGFGLAIKYKRQRQKVC